jgi:hypothetical protein
LLKEPLEKLRPRLQKGHQCLAQLLKAGYFNILLTANFDPYLQNAITVDGLTGEEMDLLIVGESTTEHIVNTLKDPQRRVKVCMLRGRLRTRTIPNVSQTLQLDPQLKKVLEDYLVQDIIVVGASDRDSDINQCIPTKGGSIWYVPSGTIESANIKLRLQARSGAVFTGKEIGFNHFFSQLVSLLDLHEPKQTDQHANVAQKRAGLRQKKRDDKNVKLVNSAVLYGTGNHWAVVVGVTDYQDQSSYSKLEDSVKDAEGIYQQFVVRSFHPSRLHLLTDHTLTLHHHDVILSRLQSTAEATSADDLLLFYYGGFVDEDDEDGYFVAWDSLHSKLQRTAVPLQQVKEIIVHAPACAKVIILDICHAKAGTSAEDREQSMERFISRAREQAEELTILASYKTKQKKSQYSVFTDLLIESLCKQNDLNTDGWITVQDIRHDLTNRVKLYPAQSSTAEDAMILCRCYKQDTESYLIPAYYYVVEVQWVLEEIQKILSPGSPITEDRRNRVLNLLYQIRDREPPSSQAAFSTVEGTSHMDRLCKISDCLNQLVYDATKLRAVRETSPVGSQTGNQPILNELADCISEANELASEFRGKLISEDIDR